jgi:hypothetical protein
MCARFKTGNTRREGGDSHVPHRLVCKKRLRVATAAAAPMRADPHRCRV